MVTDQPVSVTVTKVGQNWKKNLSKKTTNKPRLVNYLVEFDGAFKRNLSMWYCVTFPTVEFDSVSFYFSSMAKLLFVNCCINKRIRMNE